MNDKIQKICLVCMDRTGSNMISARLNTHPEVRFYNELFHRQYVIFNDTRLNGSEEMLANRDKNPAAFISQVWNGAYEPEAEREKLRAVGFKLFVNHNADALKYVTNSDAKIIFLRRRNPLSRFSSFKIAASTGEWKTTKKSDKASTVKFYPAEFRAYMQNFLSLEALYEMTLTRWNRPYFNVWYEDVVKEPRVWADLTRFIGYGPDDFGPSPIVKQNSSNILNRFSNPEEVENFVAKLGRYDWLTE